MCLYFIFNIIFSFEGICAASASQKGYPPGRNQTFSILKLVIVTGSLTSICPGSGSQPGNPPRRLSNIKSFDFEYFIFWTCSFRCIRSWIRSPIEFKSVWVQIPQQFSNFMVEQMGALQNKVQESIRGDRFDWIEIDSNDEKILRQYTFPLKNNSL